MILSSRINSGHARAAGGRHLAHEKRWNPWLLLAVGALLMLYFGGLGAIPYFEPDEGRYTEIPREMLVRRDFILPHLNGVLYFEKPPLYYWLNALSIAVFGVGEFASRFWSALLGTSRSRPHVLSRGPVREVGARAGCPPSSSGRRPST